MISKLTITIVMPETSNDGACRQKERLSGRLPMVDVGRLTVLAARSSQHWLLYVVLRSC